MKRTPKATPNPIARFLAVLFDEEVVPDLLLSASGVTSTMTTVWVISPMSSMMVLVLSTVTASDSSVVVTNAGSVVVVESDEVVVVVADPVVVVVVVVKFPTTPSSSDILKSALVNRAGQEEGEYAHEIINHCCCIPYRYCHSQRVLSICQVSPCSSLMNCRPKCR